MVARSSWFGPLTVFPGVAWPAYAQETRLQVIASAAIEAGMPQALIHILTGSTRQPPPRPTPADEMSILHGQIISVNLIVLPMPHACIVSMCYLQAAIPIVETQVSGAAQVLLIQASGDEQPDSMLPQDATCPQVVVLTEGGSGTGWPDTRRSSTHTAWKEHEGEEGE